MSYAILLWILDFGHAGQLVHDLAHGLPDEFQVILFVGLCGGLHRVPSQVIKPQCSSCRLSGGGSICRRSCIHSAGGNHLFREFGLQSDLVSLLMPFQPTGTISRQIFLLLENPSPSSSGRTQGSSSNNHPSLHVLAVGPQPVHGGEVPLASFLQVPRRPAQPRVADVTGSMERSPPGARQLPRC